MDRISNYFFSKVGFKYLEVKYWTSWTAFNKHFITKPCLMDAISFDFFSKACLKYLEAK